MGTHGMVGRMHIVNFNIPRFTTLIAGFVGCGECPESVNTMFFYHADKHKADVGIMGTGNKSRYLILDVMF